MAKSILQLLVIMFILTPILALAFFALIVIGGLAFWFYPQISFLALTVIVILAILFFQSSEGKKVLYIYQNLTTRY